MNQSIRNRTGQSVLEYATLISVVVLVIIVGQLYFKRGLQGRWKESSDQIGKQFTTAQPYTMETRQQSLREEVTGTAGEVGSKNWTRSSVLSSGTTFGNADIVKVGGKEGTYAGHETTREDFVQQSIGSGQVGAHGTFDSGKYSTTGLFNDD